jgi:hypothetical protein
VLDVAHNERSTHVVGLLCGVTGGGHAPIPSRVALIPKGEQGNRSAYVLQVALVELREGLVGSPLQRVAQVISRGRSGTMPSSSGVRDEAGCPRGAHNAHAQTCGTDDRSTRGALWSQSSTTHTAVGWGNRDGAARHNRATRQHQRWCIGSRSSVEMKRNELTFYPSNRGNNKTIQKS